jgi:hypothetical protein
MSTYVKSLKRLYEAGRLTDVRITELLENGKITEEEYQYIIG